MSWWQHFDSRWDLRSYALSQSLLPESDSESANNAAEYGGSRLNLHAVIEFVGNYRYQTRSILESDFCMVLEIILGFLALMFSHDFCLLELWLIPFWLRNLLSIYMPSIIISWRKGNRGNHNSRIRSIMYWLSQISSVLIVICFLVGCATYAGSKALMSPFTLVVFLFCAMHFMSILIPALFLLRTLLCIPLMWKWRRNDQAQFTSYQEMQRLRGQSTGLSPDEIHQLPFVPVIRAPSSSKSESVCAICQERAVVGDVLRVLSCNHYFHAECLDEWLTLHATCPLCRQSVAVESISIPVSC